MSDNPLFDVVFDGRLLAGVNRDDAIKAVAQLFKTDPAKVSSLFDGEARAIKAKVDQPTGLKYVAAMRKAGTMCRLVPHGQKPPAKPSATPPAVSPAAVSTAPAADAPLTVAPVGKRIDNLPRFEKLLDINEMDLNFDVAKAGANLLPDEFRQDVTVDLDTLDLDFDIAEAGSAILPEEYRQHEVGVEPDISALSLTEGEFDLREGQPEKEIPPPPDISGLSVAPQGGAKDK